MAKYSDLAWSEAACNNNKLSDHSFSAYLTAGELNLMSRFSSLNSSSIVIQTASDSDATSTTTSSSSSAANNSSGSLSPNGERETRQNHQNTQPIAQNASNHLLELQKEIKEEEEEIFADINSLINSRSNLYSTFDDGDEDGDEVNIDEKTNYNDENQHTTFNYSNTSNNNTTASTNITPLRNLHHKQPTDNGRHLFGHDDAESVNDYQSQVKPTIAKTEDNNSHDYQSKNDRCASATADIDDQQQQLHLEMHHDDRHYETDDALDFTHHHRQDSSYYLHGEQIDEDPHEHHTNHDTNDPQYMDDKQEEFFPLNQNDQQDYSSAIQQVTSNLPKPCVFFLEGNCRRSDCKYSHDLSNITCKYWIEGFCFKGELCPFLHSYNQPNDSSLLDEDGLQSLSKKGLNPTFAIESEADFPSLPLDAPAAAFNDSSKSSMNADAIKNQILSSNTAVVFKTVKKKRKRS